jgi:prevent-host-death family protein
MQYTISFARTHLSRLIREAESGQEVIILRNGAPAYKIIRYSKPQIENTIPTGSGPSSPESISPGK